jgi:hypothetical protein
MKKRFLLIAVLLMGFTWPDNNLTVKATLTEWNYHLNKLEAIRQIVDNSNMGNLEVKFITRTIDSLELFIVPQLKAQIDSTKK